MIQLYLMSHIPNCQPAQFHCHCQVHLHLEHIQVNLKLNLMAGAKVLNMIFLLQLLLVAQILLSAELLKANKLYAQEAIRLHLQVQQEPQAKSALWSTSGNILQ